MRFAASHITLMPMLPTVSNVCHAQLRVCIDCRPCPNVAPALRLLLGRDILFLRADELPDFVALQAADSHVADGTVMIVSTDLSQLDQKPHDRVLGDSSDANRRTDAVAFTETPDDLSAAGIV